MARSRRKRVQWFEGYAIDWQLAAPDPKHKLMKETLHFSAILEIEMQYVVARM
jgi:hypothetical protein